MEAAKKVVSMFRLMKNNFINNKSAIINYYWKSIDSIPIFRKTIFMPMLKEDDFNFPKLGFEKKAYQSSQVTTKKAPYYSLMEKEERRLTILLNS